MALCTCHRRPRTSHRMWWLDNPIAYIRRRCVEDAKVEERWKTRRKSFCGASAAGAPRSALDGPHFFLWQCDFFSCRHARMTVFLLRRCHDLDRIRTCSCDVVAISMTKTCPWLRVRPRKANCSRSRPLLFWSYSGIKKCILVARNYRAHKLVHLNTARRHISHMCKVVPPLRYPRGSLFALENPSTL